MRSSTLRLSVLVFACALSSVANATQVWQETFTTGSSGVVQYDFNGGNNMIGPVTNNQLPVTTVDNGSNAFTPDKAGEPLGTTVSGQNAFSGLYNFNWSNLNTDDDSDIVYEAAGFMGTGNAQTRPIMGVVLRHWYLPASEAQSGQNVGYYVGLDLLFGAVGITDTGYNGSLPAIYIGNSDPAPTMQLAIGFNPTSNTLSAALYDASGNLMQAHDAVISKAGGMYGAHPPAYDSDANIQAELNNLAASYLGWEDYTGNGSDFPTTWNMNSLSYYNDANGAFNTAAANIVWNNTVATGDGATWDTTTQNWNNGTPTVYGDGLNVLLNDSNNGHYTVTLSTIVHPASVTVNNNAGNYTISGSGSIAGSGALTKSGIGTLTLSTANSYSGGTNVLSGLLIAGAAGALPNGGALTIGNATVIGSVQLAPGIGPVELSALTVNTGSTLDVTNNKVIVDYSGTSPAPAIRAALTSGYASSAETGTGIISSTAAANTAGTTTLGYVDTGTQVIIKYTWVGDANLDGVVNNADLSAISTSGTTWATGDFNYDNVVNADDYALLMLGAAKSGGANISTTLPEPSVCFSALGFIAALYSRRGGRSTGVSSM
jgi:autotransporter-associated beta strand protein